MHFRGIVVLCVCICALLPSVAFTANCVALISEVLKQTRPAHSQTENSKFRLLDSALSYQSLVSKNLGDIPNLIVTDNGAASEVRTGFALQQAVVTALVDSIGLDAEDAQHAGIAAHRALVEGLGLRWTEYLSALPTKFRKKVESSPQQLNAAMMRLYKSVQIDRDFDIPYLAGYSLKDPKYIFVDRSLDTNVDLGKGVEVDTLPFLIVHEVVEVALLRRWKLPELEYWRSHQIAQRIEKAFLLANGHSWAKYQGGFVRHNINRLGKQFRYGAIPQELDLIPYNEELEHEKVRAMRAASKAVEEFSSKHFKVRQPMPNVFHLEFESSEEMARTFMRFQEHYESPHFRGKVFTTKEFIDWYTKQNGSFSYLKDWGGSDGGFNIPSWVLKPFYEGQFQELTEGERELLHFFETRKHQDFYVIATPANTDSNVLQHELAHALYYLKPEYKAAVDRLLAGDDRSNEPTTFAETELVKKWLYTEAGAYHKEVLHDEAHAWINCDLEYMAANGFVVTESLRDLSKKLNDLFQFYFEQATL